MLGFHARRPSSRAAAHDALGSGEGLASDGCPLWPAASHPGTAHEHRRGVSTSRRALGTGPKSGEGAESGDYRSVEAR